MTMIAFLLCMLIIVLIYKSPKKTLINMAIIIFVLFIFRQNIANVILEVATFDGWTNVIKVRLTDIAELLINTNLTDSQTILSRFNLTERSFKTFLNNPIIGVNYNNYNSMTIGQHTQWSDNLARFGIVGNSMIIVQYIHWFRMFNKNKRSYLNLGAMLMCWMFYILLGFLNNNAYIGLFICMFFISNYFHVLTDSPKT